MTRPRAIAAGVAAVAVLAVGATLLGAGQNRACPAIGWADISPIQLRIDSTVEVDSVDACFGPGCRPVPLSRDDDGGWAVPQTAEHLQGLDPGSVSEVTVVTSSGDDVLVNRTVEIEQERAGGGGVWPSCPGPTDYLPVVVDASSQSPSLRP